MRNVKEKELDQDAAVVKEGGINRKDAESKIVNQSDLDLISASSGDGTGRMK